MEKRYKPYHKKLANSQLKWLAIGILITICVITFFPEDDEEKTKNILSIILSGGVLIYWLKRVENLFPPRLIVKVHKALNDIGIDLL